MNDAEYIWQNRSDDDLLEAAAELDQFTVEGQAIIRAELQRRGLEDPVTQAAEAAGPAPDDDDEEDAPLECLRCRTPIEPLGPDDAGRTRHSLWGERPIVDAGGPLQVFACPRCGHVELFLTPLADGGADEA